MWEPETITIRRNRENGNSVVFGEPGSGMSVAIPLLLQHYTREQGKIVWEYKVEDIRQSHRS